MISGIKTFASLPFAKEQIINSNENIHAEVNLAWSVDVFMLQGEDISMGIWVSAIQATEISSNNFSCEYQPPDQAHEYISIPDISSYKQLHKYHKPRTDAVSDTVRQCLPAGSLLCQSTPKTYYEVLFQVFTICILTLGASITISLLRTSTGLFYCLNLIIFLATTCVVILWSRLL